jgi:RHS repeat-associated protein
LYDFCRRTRNTTYERDSELALDYAMNRYMSNAFGRFHSADKGGFRLSRPGMLNRYSYALSDPINGTDPTGNTRDDEEEEEPPPAPPQCASGLDACSGPYAGYDYDPLAEEEQGVPASAARMNLLTWYAQQAVKNSKNDCQALAAFADSVAAASASLDEFVDSFRILYGSEHGGMLPDRSMPMLKPRAKAIRQIGK